MLGGSMMKLFIVYATILYGSIWAMEEYNKIKELLATPQELATYLESQDQQSRTPLMRFLNKGTDAMLEEVLPLLKGCKFNLEVPGPLNETAYFNACDRPTITGAVLMAYLGAKIDAETAAGKPFHLAFYNDNIPLLEYLLYEGQTCSQIPEYVQDFVSKFPDSGEFKRVLEHKKRVIPAFARKLLLRVAGTKIKKTIKKR
jgi:hypothetical protein